jgi:hypothetical protein
LRQLLAKQTIQHADRHRQQSPKLGYPAYVLGQLIAPNCDVMG